MMGDPQVGRTLGKYQLLRLVGEGGMGKVYEALNTTIQKHVALKCIDGKLAQHDDVVARFQREALAAGAVDSPYIVQIFDAGQADGVPFIVMELLRGRGLAALIRERRRLTPSTAVAVTRQVLKGLMHAHEAGIVHRDLKPDNVFLVVREGEPARVKLLDFGVSKFMRHSGAPLKTLTRQGMVVGTPYYMSPEQAQALPDIDWRTDIYSVGAMLYECLAGIPPHDGASYEQIIVSICMHDAPDLRILNKNVSAALATVVHKALAREPAKRYASAKEMLAALDSVAPQNATIDVSRPGLAAPAGANVPVASTLRMDTPMASSHAGDATSGVKPIAPPTQSMSNDNVGGSNLPDRGVSGGAVATTTLVSSAASRDVMLGSAGPAARALPTKRSSVWLWAAAAVAATALVGSLWYWLAGGGVDDDAAAVAPALAPSQQVLAPLASEAPASAAHVQNNVAATSATAVLSAAPTGNATPSAQATHSANTPRPHRGRPVTKAVPTRKTTVTAKTATTTKAAASANGKSKPGGLELLRR